MIKTLQGHEKKKLLSILDSFIKHFVMNKDSLISRIYGIYTLMTSGLKPIDIIVMQSTAVLLDKTEKLLEFDLKGSITHRITQTREKHISKLTLKD